MLLINKEVDYSLLTAGLTIPVLFQNLLLNEIGFICERGRQERITVELDGTFYNAMISNIDFDVTKYPTHKDLLQIRYGKNSPLTVALREHFGHSEELINRKKAESIKRQLVKLDVSEREYLSIYSTDVKGLVSFECITNRELTEENRELCALGEEVAERIFNTNDDTAGITLKTRVCKIRRLNRSISEDLKKVYGYRCQICGSYIGEKYDSNLIHAHHIQYYSKSLNNSTGNIMIVCPNHHGIIHDTNPTFDFAKKVYIYPNGYVEGLVLNHHI